MADKPKITIDGQIYEFEPGDTIMKAAERANIDQGIPRFCYHPGLPVAGTCRMCTVEIEKSPKLMTACSTPAGDGMVVHTQSEKARKSRSGVMEFLLTNHPLDCPVCDKAGECSLQNYNFEYGPATSEFKEKKRVFRDKTTKVLSDKLTLNMNRCVHCERCVRFTESVTKTNELLMNHRGWRKELSTALEEGIFNEYQGNIADICPVGAITFNDFRFKKRVWFLKDKPTLCDGCSKGCSVHADEEHGVVHRYRARINPKVNGHWICDPGRVSFHRLQDGERIIEPLLRSKDGAGLAASNWLTMIPWLREELSKSKKLLCVIGSDATQEEAQEMMKQLPTLASHVEFRSYNGEVEDGPVDDLLRRKDQTPNARGLKDLGLKPLEAKSEPLYDLAIYFRSGRAGLLPRRVAEQEIAWGVFFAPEVAQASYSAVLPGPTHLEKKGSYINCDGVAQSFDAVAKAKASAATPAQVFKALAQSNASKKQEPLYGSH